MNGSNPEARQVTNTVLDSISAESPISCPRAHIAHVGMIRLKGDRILASPGDAALIISRMYSARQGTVRGWW